MKKTKAIRDHWTRVAELGCIVSGRPAEIAHVHGGSISLMLGPGFRPGMGQKQNHWLVLPLSAELHRGRHGLDTHPNGVVAWEIENGTQIRLLEELSYRLGFCVFEKAGIEGYEHWFLDCPEDAA